jgi:uncharacterized protein (TIRG00374 family)
VLLAYVLLIPERFVAAWRNQLLTARVGIRLSVWRIWEINTTATFYSTFLPGDLAAGAVRWYKLSRPERKRAQAFAALTFDRLVDTLGLAFLGLAFWWLDVPRMTPSAVGWSFAALFVGISGVLLVSVVPTTATLVRQVLEDRRLVRWTRWLREPVRKILESVGAYRDLGPTTLAGLTALTLARHLLSLAILMCFAWALGIAIGAATMGWVRSLINVITMLPISFSGLGVREGSLVVLLEPFGVAGSQAIAFSFLTLLMHLVLAAAGGLLEAAQIVRPGAAEAAPGSDLDAQN